MTLRTAPSRRSDSQAEQILKMIEQGDLSLGDRLPGQRELAEQLNVGRSTVREAIRHLEAIGVLETRLGLGTYVVSTTPYSFETPLNAWLAENKDKVIKIFEVRDALESKAAELAAVNAKQEDLLKMNALLKEMEKNIHQHNPARMTELDLEFHDLIAQVSDNDLLYQILTNISDTLMDARKAVLSLPGRAMRSLHEHRAILSALQASDPQAAKEAMTQHLSNAISDVL